MTKLAFVSDIRTLAGGYFGYHFLALRKGLAYSGRKNGGLSKRRTIQSRVIPLIDGIVRIVRDRGQYLMDVDTQTPRPPFHLLLSHIHPTACPPIPRWPSQADWELGLLVYYGRKEVGRPPEWEVISRPDWR
jgi:hypothetical protein